MNRGKTEKMKNLRWRNGAFIAADRGNRIFRTGKHENFPVFLLTIIFMSAMIGHALKKVTHTFLHEQATVV